jgi:hypothetical protein
MNLNPLNPHYGSYMLAELAAQSDKLRRYPRHSVNCVIHIEPEVCNCGTEEAEQEQASEETEAETRDIDSDEGQSDDT